MGLLLFPVALLVLTLPSWSERQTTARAVAREVGRVVAVRGVCDRARAIQTAAVMAENLGLSPSELEVDVDCGDGARLERGSDLGSRSPCRSRRSISRASAASASGAGPRDHREPVDQYRSFDP